MQKVDRTNKDCEAYGTAFCGYAGSEGCEDCQVGMGNMKEEIGDMVSSWEITAHHLPEDIDEFHTRNTCQFSKGQNEEATGYAMLDLVHPEPKHMRGMLFGFGKKVRSPVGSMIQVPIPVCAKVKKFYKTREYIKWSIIAAFIAVGIVAMMLISNGSTGEESVSWIYGLGAVIVSGVAGLFVARAYNKNFTVKYESDFYVDVRKLPMIEKLEEMGWSAFHTENSGAPVMFFVKEKPRPHILFKGETSAENPTLEPEAK